MKNIIITYFLLFLSICIFAQNEAPILSSNAYESFSEIAPELRPGVFKDGENVFVSEESKRLLTDALYRDMTYPSKYTIEKIPNVLEEGRTQLALWYVINLFEENTLFGLKLLKDFNSVDISGEDYINAFNTYVYADPEIVDFSQGKMQIMHPEILDQKLKIANYLALASEKIKSHARGQ
jgi:hypothetical protein